MRFPLWIGSALLLVLSCSFREESQPARSSSFFDVPEFIDGEIARLQKRHIGLRKFLQLNGKADTLDVPAPDLETELDAFLKADINRPALGDAYAVDSLWAKDYLKKVIYRARKKELTVRQLSIHFQPDGMVQEIRIRTLLENAISRQELRGWYKSGEAFQIRVEQKLLGKKEDLEILGLFRTNYENP